MSVYFHSNVSGKINAVTEVTKVNDACTVMATFLTYYEENDLFMDSRTEQV